MLHFILQWQADKDPEYFGLIKPRQGPFHLGFNALQDVVLLHRTVFERIYKACFGQNRILPKKPKPWRMATLIAVSSAAWPIVREQILNIFGPCKDPEFAMLFHLFDELVPLVFYVYDVFFRGCQWDRYFHSLVRLSIMFIVQVRCHYDRATLCAISDFVHERDTAQLQTFYQQTCQFLNAWNERKVNRVHSNP